MRTAGQRDLPARGCAATTGRSVRNGRGKFVPSCISKSSAVRRNGTRHHPSVVDQDVDLARVTLRTGAPTRGRRGRARGPSRTPVVTPPRICPAARSPFSVLRQASTTVAPCAARSPAVAAPNPLLAPVTTIGAAGLVGNVLGGPARSASVGSARPWRLCSHRLGRNDQRVIRTRLLDRRDGRGDRGERLQPDELRRCPAQRRATHQQGRLAERSDREFGAEPTPVRGATTSRRGPAAGWVAVATRASAAMSPPGAAPPRASTSPWPEIGAASTSAHPARNTRATPSASTAAGDSGLRPSASSSSSSRCGSMRPAYGRIDSTRTRPRRWKRR